MHDSHIPVFIHIAAGCLGILTGFLTLFLRKGSRGHRRAGNVFFASMLVTSAIAAYMAYVGTEIKPPSMANTIAGVFTFYLVSTAWLTARRRDGQKNAVDLVAALIPLGIGVFAVRLTYRVAVSPPGASDIPLFAPIILSSVALLSAVGDVRAYLRGLAGARRIARHLWRMCFALWIAASSFFIGQPQVFPEWLHRTRLLFVPSIAIIVLMLFWLIRVSFSKAFGKPASLQQTVSDPSRGPVGTRVR